MAAARTFRLGTGAGFSADRLDPAVELAAKGELDALVFECIGERTLAFGHRDRMADPAAGYNPLLERRLRAVLPLCVQSGTRLITNMGVANPAGAVARAVAVAQGLGLKGLKIAALLGDDVSALLDDATPLPDAGITLGEVGRRMVGANAYLGADAILPALAAGADVVITGRVADPSLFLAPLRHAFGWAADDWAALGAGLQRIARSKRRKRQHPARPVAVLRNHRRQGTRPLFRAPLDAQARHQPPEHRLNLGGDALADRRLDGLGNPQAVGHQYPKRFLPRFI
jgi:hypothetical protein